jgi:hypothetical protein
VAVVGGSGRRPAAGGGGGPLTRLRLRIGTRAQCGLGAGVLCAASLTGGTCDGDSGAGLVTTAAAPRLVAVLSGRGASNTCRKNVLSVYVDLATASARAFVHGHAGAGKPPPAPAERWVPSGWKGYALKLTGERDSLAFSLPRSWTSTPSPFVVSNRRTGTEVRAAWASGTWTKARYFADSLENARANYRKTDPDAVLHSRELSLPGIQVLEISVSLMVPHGGRRVLTTVREYSFVENHRGYELQCFWPASHDRTNIPLFDQFVRTIHFVH